MFFLHRIKSSWFFYEKEVCLGPPGDRDYLSDIELYGLLRKSLLHWRSRRLQPLASLARLSKHGHNQKMAQLRVTRYDTKHAVFMNEVILCTSFIKSRSESNQFCDGMGTKPRRMASRRSCRVLSLTLDNAFD